MRDVEGNACAFWMRKVDDRLLNAPFGYVVRSKDHPCPYKLELLMADDAR
jgi:hypothetical protein